MWGEEQWRELKMLPKKAEMLPVRAGIFLEPVRLVLDWERIFSTAKG